MRAAIYIFALALMICVRAQKYPARSKSRLPGALATTKLENALLSHGGSRTSVVKESVLLDIRGGAIEASQIGSSLSFPQMKFLLQILLSAFNVLCWTLPLNNKIFSTNERALSISNCFAGGIFLMLSFGHLIPESISSLSALGGNGYDALYYVIGGFLAMVFVGKVIFRHEPPIVPTQPHENRLNAKSVATGINSAVILCMAMSIHSFFESAALGMVKDIPSALVLSACIALHQPAESLALVVAFLKANMPRHLVLAWLIGFSIVGIIGCAVGIWVKVHAPPSVEALVVAMTAGTFVYVGAAEILGEEFEDRSLSKRMINFAAYLLGMLAMYFVSLTVAKWESILSS